MTRIVLAWMPGCSAGAVSWLAAHHEAEVVTVMLDFGQGRELEALRDRALAAGAVRAHVLDVATEFAATFVLPALEAGALSLDGRSRGPELERMVAAAKLVEVAAIEQTATVAHALADGGRRFATAVTTLDPRLTVLGVPPSALADPDPYDDLGAAPAATRRAEPALLDLTFVQGVPTAINGVAMPLSDLIGTINMLAGVHTGRVNHRGTAAATLLHSAHRGLQDTIAVDQAERRALADQYAELIDTGAWFSTARPPLDAAVARLEASVSGVVRLRLVDDASEIVDIMAHAEGVNDTR